MKTSSIILLTSLAISSLLTQTAENSLADQLYRQEQLLSELEQQCMHHEKDVLKANLPLHFNKITSLTKNKYHLVSNLLETRLKYYRALAEIYNMQQDVCIAEISRLFSMPNKLRSNNDVQIQVNAGDRINEQRKKLVDFIKQVEVDAKNVQQYAEKK